MMKVKVTNAEVMKATGLTKDKFYYRQKHFPREIELIKKGLFFEKLDLLYRNGNKKVKREG